MSEATTKRELGDDWDTATMQAEIERLDDLTIRQLRKIEQLTRERDEAKREIDRLGRGESLVVADVEAGLRHLGDDQLADRFAESTSPIHQRLMMVFHCLTLAAERQEEKR